MRSTLPFFVSATVLCFAASNAGVIDVPGEGIRTIADAISKARAGDTVRVAPGVYNEHVAVRANVALVAREAWQCVVDGGGRGNVVTLSNGAAVVGLDIRNGAAGVFSRGAGTEVRRCRIYQNRVSGIMCVGALPAIEDNLVVFNQGSGVQALQISSGSTVMDHNTIAYNSNHGIIVGASVAVRIQNSILSSNRGLGIKIDGPAENVVLSHNAFHANGGFTMSLPIDNYLIDPQFAAPRRKKMDFSLKPESEARGRGIGHEDLGARM